MNDGGHSENGVTSMLRWLVSACLLVGCTAPPPGHPYWPIAADNAWQYRGREESEGSRSSNRDEGVAISTVEVAPGRTRAAVRESSSVEGWHSGWEVTLEVTAQGLSPRLPPGGRASGVELPADLVGAAPWEHAVHWDDRGTRRGEVGRSAVVGRRRVTVAAGTFDTVVVRTELRFERSWADGSVEADAYVMLRDFACGVGMVQRVLQDSAGHGHALALQAFRVEGEHHGCTAESLAALPVYGAEAVAAAASRGCSVAAVEALGAALIERPSAALRAATPTRLQTACAAALPPSIAVWLATGRDPSPLAREPEVEAWLDRLCPGVASLQMQPRAHDVVAIHEACGLDRLGVLARDEIDGTARELLPWALYSWFVEQGVSRAAAGAIARALLAREWRARSRFAPEIRLPEADGRAIAADEPLLSATPDELRFLDAREPLVGGVLPAEDPRPLPLQDVRLAIQWSTLQDERPAQDHSLLIAADASMQAATPVVVLGRLRLGPRRVRWVVERAEGRLRSIELASFAADRPWLGDADSSPMLLATLTSGRAWLRTGLHAGLAPADRPALADAVVELADVAALARHAAAFREVHPDAHRVVVKVPLGVTVDEFIAAVVALRGPRCDTTGECILPDVHVWSDAMPQD